VFSQLSAVGIEVLSMRNKVNRLEEIFMRLVDGRGTAAAAPAAEARQAGQA
jgi:ABC-2 type transport system ATP-binding protein